MSYYFARDDELIATEHPPAGTKPLAHSAAGLQPAQVTALHHSFRAWGRAGYSPGHVVQERVWFGPSGALAFYFGGDTRPAPLLQVGQAPDLAAWLVLLDKWVDTATVLAGACKVWSPVELVGALTFMTPGYLPRSLVTQPPDNWARVARMLACAVGGDLIRKTPAFPQWAPSSRQVRAPAP